MDPTEHTLADFRDERAGTYVRVIGEESLSGVEPCRTEVEVGGKFVPLAELLAAYQGDRAVEEVSADA